MITPETDAKLKSCPYFGTCKGAECMAWQWEDLGYTGGVATHGFCGMVHTTGCNKNQAVCPY